MSAAVLIPWRDTACPHRERALSWVLTQLAEHPWPVVIGRHDKGPWCKAKAVDDALAQTDAETLIIHDADVLTDGLSEAVRSVQEGMAWAIPHRSSCGIFRLSAGATEALLSGAAPDLKDLDERPYDGVACGGVFVVQRRVYEDCPMDPRFEGFGGEDESLGWALRALHGAPWRGTSRLVHLWHPPQERVSRTRGSDANVALRKRYARLRFRPDDMRRLVKEAQDAHRPSVAQHDDRRTV